MPEILAPVGNADMLKAAVANGADAVYLGLGKFSARSKAVGFVGSELKDAIEYAHLFGVKVYGAINTLIKNDEIDGAINAVDEALKANIDALIVQDIGFAGEIRRKYPHAVLHASTQMGIHNAEGAAIAKKLGFSRIILSRETLLEDIIKIKNTVDIEIECFVQGALCIAFSGNCYFSSLASGFSGNRGKCMQLCRKKYSAVIGGKYKEGYLLSAKDLMLANRLSDLIAAGVDCFKIEGRLRRPEYVAEAVRIYKKALQGAFTRADLDALKKVFNRGDYTEGHLICGTAKVLDINICSHKGAFVGKVLKVSGNKAKLSCGLNKGDGIKFLRGGEEVGAASITHDGFDTGFEGSVKSGDDVYITTDSRFNAEVLSRKRKLPVKISVDFDKKLLEVICSDATCRLEIEGAERAKNLPLSEKVIIDCFDKSDYFTAENVSLSGEPSFMTKAALNALRRNAYEALKENILASYNKKMPSYIGKYLSMPDIISHEMVKFLESKPIYQVESVDQITENMEVIAINPREYSVKFLSEFAAYYDKALLALPVIARGKDMEVLKEIVSACNFKGYIVNNLYGLELVKNKPVILGYGLNIINDLIDAPKIYSFESDKVLSNGYVYEGNVPLMNFCHCEKKELQSGCENCTGYDITLSSEGRSFYLRRYKIHYCYAQLLNCSDLKADKEIKKAFIDLSFKRAGSFTKGNYKRGLK